MWDGVSGLQARTEEGRPRSSTFKALAVAGAAAMLRRGCQRLGAQLCCTRRGLRASESGHRNLVSCIDRKALPRVQVFRTREGPRSALSSPGGLHRGHRRPGSPRAVTPGQVTHAGPSSSGGQHGRYAWAITLSCPICVASLAALTISDLCLLCLWALSATRPRQTSMWMRSQAPETCAPNLSLVLEP